MKLNFQSSQFCTACFLVLLSLGLFANDAEADEARKPAYTIRPEDIITSVHAGHLQGFQVVAVPFADERNRLGNELLNVLRADRSNLNRCAAAHYLGELRFAEAANDLAAQITLDIKLTDDLDGMPVLPRPVAMTALIRIGVPAIAPVIRNLETSDDAKVRELSLKVLRQIDGDKDIVQLRLQKALDAQKDPEKKARLQAALKSLAETQFQ